MSTFVWDECQLSQNGIQYNENHDDYSIQISRDSTSTATRKLTCAWGDAVDLAQALRGNTVEVGGEIVYTDAASHPILSALKVSNVNIQPIGKPLTTGVWEQAFLTVQYDIPEFGGASVPDSVELREESLDISAFNEQIPQAKIQFENGDPVEEDVYATVRVMEYRTTLYRQTSLPVIAIAGLVNKVNNDTWEGVPAGYALYGGAEATRTITDEGAQEWTITHVVFVGDKDQRKRWNPQTSSFEKVEFKNGGDNIIESGSFSSVGL